MSQLLPSPRIIANKEMKNEKTEKTQQLPEARKCQKRWKLGILNGSQTNEAPGSVFLFTKNQPELDLKEDTLSNSSHNLKELGVKKTSDGRFILNPQPDDSPNDPLNWTRRRKEILLVSIGLYSMVGGGMTPLLAAGFTDVASTFHVETSKVSLTTGVFMLGLGIGSIIVSPTAIIFGKRLMYLFSVILFSATSAWCAASPNFYSLIFARLLQGISVSPVECLPSATITEVFFLHERAYRIGIYSLLLLGGKNLVPLVSAAIIQSMGWRWTFWITLIVVAFCGILLFLFVPETFWIRGDLVLNESLIKRSALGNSRTEAEGMIDDERIGVPIQKNDGDPKTEQKQIKINLDGFRNEKDPLARLDRAPQDSGPSTSARIYTPNEHQPSRQGSDEISIRSSSIGQNGDNTTPDHLESNKKVHKAFHKCNQESNQNPGLEWVRERLDRPRIGFVEELQPYTGKKSNLSWLGLAIRPFILFAYPAIFWSAAVYACSVGWLIVVSESITLLFRSENTYGFSALSTGLIYLSPFIGGIFGTAGGGKVSDMIARYMSERNDNIFEPEFRLVLAIPISISTIIGLIGLGWSTQIVDAWIVPAIFLGLISFGCTLGATTAITFCVDSYRFYAAESLVTLNFSKNVFHGFVFSLFVSKWIEIDGPKTVYVWLGVMELILMAFTIPMYIFGKRARMWTARLKLMENF